MHDVTGIFFDEKAAYLSNNEPTTRLYATKYAFWQIELMQWTGLQDVDHNYLYIGDIIKFADEETDDYLLRAIETEHLGFDFRWTRDNHILKQCEWTDRFKIMGNIYENPELLKERNR